MTVTIDNNTCIGCGSCAAICPTIFKMNQDTNKAEIINLSDCGINCNCQDTAQACPTGSIIITE